MQLPTSTRSRNNWPNVENSFSAITLDPKEIGTSLFYSKVNKIYQDTCPVSFIQFDSEIKILEFLLETFLKKAKTLALR